MIAVSGTRRRKSVIWCLPGQFMKSPLLFDLGARPTTRQVADLVKDGGVAALPDARRRGDLARTPLPLRGESLQGHAVHELDVHPLSRVHAWVSLLLRAKVPATPRARCGRSIRIGDFREDEFRRGVTPRAR